MQISREPCGHRCDSMNFYFLDTETKLISIPVLGAKVQIAYDRFVNTVERVNIDRLTHESEEY